MSYAFLRHVGNRFLNNNGTSTQGQFDMGSAVVRKIQHRPIFKDFRSIELPALTIRSTSLVFLRDLLAIHRSSIGRDLKAS